MCIRDRLGTIVAAMITGYATNNYLNMSLFLAFAALFPEEEVLLFFVCLLYTSPYGGIL